jgi:hypothetical protein
MERSRGLELEPEPEVKLDVQDQTEMDFGSYASISEGNFKIENVTDTYLLREEICLSS